MSNSLSLVTKPNSTHENVNPSEIRNIIELYPERCLKYLTVVSQKLNFGLQLMVVSGNPKDKLWVTADSSKLSFGTYFLQIGQKKG